MRSLLLLGLGLAVGVTAYGQAQRTHERLQAGLEWINMSTRTNMISPAGHAVYTTKGPLGQNVFLGSVNYSNLVAHGPHWAEATGITDEGLPIWGFNGNLYVGLTDISSQYGWAVIPGYPAPQRGRGGHISYPARNKDGRALAVLDGQDISSPVLGKDGNATGISAPNRFGEAYWGGRGTVTDDYRDLFRGTVNFTAPILGSNRDVSGRGFNDAGQILWEGKGTNTGGKWKVFLDDRDMTTPIFGAQGYGSPEVLNQAGQVLWLGGSVIGMYYVMLDDRNVSLPVVGSGPHVLPSGLSENGHVLWTAVDAEEDWNLYLDDFNLSLAAIGDPRASVNPLHFINATGHVAWSGFDRSEPKVHVYYDTFDLTRDALGDIVIVSGVLDLGDGGHVLWWTESTEFPGRFDVWISTPVPEPSIPLLAPLLLLLMRRYRLRQSPK